MFICIFSLFSYRILFLPPSLIAMESVLIIGAGISGLLAAQELRRAGLRVKIVEKSRGVGGRMATRRIASVYGEAKADHGTQYLTSRHSSRFAAVLQSLQESGTLALWAGPPIREQTDKGRLRGERFIAPQGMTAPAKELAQGLDITLGERVVGLSVSQGARAAQWRAVTDNNSVVEADALLLTSPVPQTLALLDAGAPAPLLSAEERSALEAVSYAPCIAVMLALAPPAKSPPLRLPVADSSLQWATGNLAKGVRAETESLTLHLNADFSRKHWETPEADLLPLVWQELRKALAAFGEDVAPEAVAATSVHRWRFSRVTAPFGKRFYALESSRFPPCVLAGDAFASNASAEEPARVEDAAVSAWAATEYLLSRR
jgi:predicted NAD/FAD-dependent oxidoreductase